MTYAQALETWRERYPRASFCVLMGHYTSNTQEVHMEKRVVHTDKAASGKVPLSQAIQVGEWLHCSGQLPLDPATGELVPGGAGEQTRRIIENLKAVCEAGGTSLKNAVKVTIFMEDLADLGEMNAVFEEYFGIEDPPARTTFQASKIIAGAKLEIELLAFIPQ